MTCSPKAEELLDFQRQLLGAMNAGQSFQGLAEVLSSSIDRPVLIVSPLHRVVASWGLNPNLPRGSTLTLVNSEDDPRLFKIASEQGQWEARYFPLKGEGDRLLGYLLLGGVKKDARIEAMGELAAPLCSLEFSRVESLQEIERKHRDNFIFDLLYSNIDTEETIITWGELWGWDLKRTHAVAVFALEGYEHTSSEQDIMRLLFQIGEEACQGNDLPSILMIKRGELIAIISLADRRKKMNRKVIKGFISSLMEKVIYHLPERTIRVGVGRRYDSPTEIFRSYQEAKVALELGKLIKSSQNTPFFSDLGMARLLFSHDWQELEEFYRETFGELREQELMETLEAYLSHGCDLKATAQSLFLHPNSLRYRLKKIEELLERNLEEIDTKVDLVVALKIKHLLDLN